MARSNGVAQKALSYKKICLKLNYRLYRKLQIVHVLGRFLANREKYGVEFQQLLKLLKLREKVFLIFPTLIHDTYITHTIRKREYYINLTKEALFNWKQKIYELLLKMYILQIYSFFKNHTPTLIKRANRLTARIFRYGIRKVFKLISTPLIVDKRKIFIALSKVLSHLKRKPRVQKKYVMMIINPKENTYSNAREIFEQYIPVDCNKANKI